MLNEISDLIGQVFINGTFTALARIVDWSNDLLVQADCDTIMYSIVDSAGDLISGHTDVSLVVADVIFDTLQTTPTGLWTADSLGYNLSWTIHVSTNPAFANADTYEVVFTIQPTTGQAIIVRYQITAF